MQPRNEYIFIDPSCEWGLQTLTNSSGLQIGLLPSGAVHAIRHGSTLINQYLASPAEIGLSRLYLRALPSDIDESAELPAHASTLLAIPGQHFEILNNLTARWTTLAGPLHCTATLLLHETHSAWSWRIRVHNSSSETQLIDAFYAQDLGLADEAAVRNNEAYVSQYIDMYPIQTTHVGPVVFARQNMAQSEARHPWLGVACATKAVAYCTDGQQFFGIDHRLTGTPAALRMRELPSLRLQHEFSLIALQSLPSELTPGETTEIVFAARYVEDHPAVSSATDLTLLQEVTHLPLLVNRRALRDLSEFKTPLPSEPVSLFVSSDWIHGAQPTQSDLENWFSGPFRHVEYDDAVAAPESQILSFFAAADTHVVTRAKEAHSLRPHGHILRSGDSRWIDDSQFGVTSYAAGIFRAQAYFGNPAMTRFLTPVRNALNVIRAAGERIFIRFQRDAAWYQLGVPSAFAMTPGDSRWFYLLPGNHALTIRVWCSPKLPVSHLELQLTGTPAEFLFTYSLALGPTENERGGAAELHVSDNRMTVRPHTASLIAQHMPGTAFTIATQSPDTPAIFSGAAALLSAPSESPWTLNSDGILSLRTAPLTNMAVILGGGPDDSLREMVAEARQERLGLPEENVGTAPARPPGPPVRLSHDTMPAVSRVNEILPWFTHNASIHFTAPHGLEQYGGGAWGVRDVCQGSLEYFLSLGDLVTARRMLLDVFAQQYPQGDWPQWYMHSPFRFIQQAHSHGDICFWPVKALCDYVEASNDFAILQARVPYTNRGSFTPIGPNESLLEHCEHVLSHCKHRFLAGTSLVNYGDGDWDDTLQPADDSLRTRMVSAWTVALSYQTFNQLAQICRHDASVHAEKLTARLDQLLPQIRDDFNSRLMPDDIVAGFLVSEPEGEGRVLLHPRDAVTGINYRLLPMTRAIIAELFTSAQAASHLDIIRRELLFPDGAHLMNVPATYRGGVEHLFKRADTAANFGREIGLQYVHAHLRYAEALAKVGDAEGLWHALQVVNPVALSATVPNAARRQANHYFSSSDASFDDRYQASTLWLEAREGKVPVNGGWRLYSSGPGLYLHKVRACLLGLREQFGSVVFDPVMPHSLNELVAHATLCERPVTIRYHIHQNTHAPASLTVNGSVPQGMTRVSNPYRAGGFAIESAHLTALLNQPDNLIEITM